MSSVATTPTGLSVMEAIREGTLEPPPAARLLGLDVAEVAEGHITFAFTAEERFGNWTSVHGGVLAAVCDFAVTTAVMTTIPAASSLVTTNLNVAYLRPLALDGRQALVTGDVLHVGRTLAQAEATATDADGRVLVRATATCHIGRP